MSYRYEYLIGNKIPYLCAIPEVQIIVNETEESSKPKTESDLVAAADRGWQLLKDMENQQCLYYTTGWWSYMFCYNSYVKQYHAVAASSHNRQWPPPEDPNTPNYILGAYNAVNGKKASLEGPPQPKAGDLQTQSETTFLVQRLDGGTPCDLTGKPRKIEVQYHCSPGTADRIGWIKETATCAYQMVIYTSRLCNDIVFQPPKGANLHKIECQRIATGDEAAEWSAGIPDPPAINEAEQQRVMVGKVELGGRQIIGREGKKIERGRIVMTAEEQAEIVVVQEDGQIRSLSSAELKKLQLDPKEVAAFQKEMQKLAGSSDWKIERLDDANGQLSLRGVVSADAKKKAKGAQDDATKKDDDESNEPDEVGSEEHFKDEI